MIDYLNHKHCDISLPCLKQRYRDFFAIPRGKGKGGEGKGGEGDGGERRGREGRGEGRGDSSYAKSTKYINMPITSVVHHCRSRQRKNRRGRQEVHFSHYSTYHGSEVTVGWIRVLCVEPCGTTLTRSSHLFVNLPLKDTTGHQDPLPLFVRKR